MIFLFYVVSADQSLSSKVKCSLAQWSLANMSCALMGMAEQLCSAGAVDQNSYIWPHQSVRLVQLLMWPSVSPKEVFQDIQAKLSRKASSVLTSEAQSITSSASCWSIKSIRQGQIPGKRSLLSPLKERNNKEFIAILSFPQKQLMEQDSEQFGESKLKARVKGYP